MLRSVAIAIILLFSSSAAFAQGGSNYSIFGVGDIRRSVSSAYDGLGGTQIAVTSPYAVNLLNPAAWGALESTRLQGGFRFNQQTISNGTTTADQNNGKLDGFCLAFSIDTALGIGAALGVHPYSSVNYSLATPFSDSLLGRRIDGSVESAGTGGLTSIFLGAAARPVENLRVGAAVVGIFGTIYSTVQTIVYDANAYRSVNQRNDGFKGVGGRFGAIYSPSHNFNIGLSATIFANLKVNSQTRLSTISANEITSDTVIDSELESSLPSSLGLGFSYISGKFLFAADAEIQDFSTMTYRQGRSEFKQMLRLSGGISRLGSSAPGTAFGDRVSFNFGVGYQQLYYSVFGTQINEMYGSFGMQIPVSQSAMLDVAMTGGSRGATGSGIVRELFLRFGFSVSIGEVWFQPFARE